MTVLVGVLAMAGMAAGTVSFQDTLPVLELRADDTQVSASCRVVIPEGVVIRDAGGDGVLQVVADDVRVVFEAGSVLRGAPAGTPGDRMTGLGIAVIGRRGVSIEGARIEGFAVGLLGRRADGLVLQDVVVRDGLRQRLRSTAAAADDSADWLAPHDNDARQWVTSYGAALCIERSKGVTVQRCTARGVQNGLILDRVSGARVCDNDFSYLSGWGVALWRVEASSITRNALDFCVRGYSHGTYNRGQDSAGLLMFEQCHDNFIAQNSITHGGDGIFAFSGREALGEGGRDLGPGAHAGLGHHGNWFVGNDLSFAAAHGLELTFAGINVIRENRFEGNAICGVWGGYSSGLQIIGNSFEANGDAGYGLERGGVNVEHGTHIAVVGNRFEGNRCGVHFWWDEDSQIQSLPWARDNGVACGGNVVVDNVFRGDEVGVQLRECAGTLLSGNRWEGVDRRTDVQGEAPAEHALPTPDGWVLEEEAVARPAWMELAGRTRPVGARPRSRGREHILMTRWGPWDGAAVAWHTLFEDPGGCAYRLLGAPGALESISAGAAGPHVSISVDGDTVVIVPASGRRGVLPWRLELPGAPALHGALLAARWRVTCFPSPCDPREDIETWRTGARGDRAVTLELDSLDLPFQAGGPAELGWAGALPVDASDGPFPSDHFGTVAQTSLFLPAGRWRLTTLSDDGLRVVVDGELLVDDWTWHGPTPHEVVLEIDEAREVSIAVEHFELDGWAVLRVALEPLEPDAR